MINRNNAISRWWHSIDQTTFLLILTLFAISLLLVTTSSPAVANRIGLTQYYFISRQFIYLGIALCIIIFFSFLDFKTIKWLAILGTLVSIILLILTKFYGYEAKGAKRWINILSFSMQPSEFLKPFLWLFIAWILSIKQNQQSFPSFTIILILYLIISELLITQPDFGMWLLISIIIGVQIFIAGIHIIWIILISCIGSTSILVAYFFIPHVQQRFSKFFHPTESNYQVTKSLQAFNNGGLYGRGPGEGYVKQFLPDSHTDFIFAVAGEEFGMIMCLLISCTFLFIVIRGLMRLTKEDDHYKIFSIVGLLSQISLQASINMGVTLNLLPTKGMTLPFISYGGSTSLSMAIVIGMLLALTKSNPYQIHHRIKKFRI